MRECVLRTLNVGRLKRFIKRECSPGKTPIFLVVIPDIVHMAPLAVSLRHPSFQPVLLANGVDRIDQAWLREMVGDIPLFSMQVSLKGNRASMLGHGTVIQYLMLANAGIFCIQDPDCFVTDMHFFETVALDDRLHYAAGPFATVSHRHPYQIPSTPFLCLNARLFRQLRSRYGLQAGATAVVPRRLVKILQNAGFGEGVYPDKKKAYYDTLQMFWIVAHESGARFKALRGEDESVFHIGGTSYLSSGTLGPPDEQLWRLNAHYFHLRLLSLPKCARFRQRFSHLFQEHGGPEALVSRYPEYAKSRGLRRACRILEALHADQLYR